MLKNFVLLFLTSMLFASCEEVIELDLEEGESQMVVDAFISNEAKIQRVILTRSAAYFNNSLPVGVSGASVSLSGSDGSEYIFTENTKGSYEYDAGNLAAIDSIGTKYTLKINYNGKEYRSSSYLNPVPPIDSIVFYQEKNPFTGELGYFAEFFAKDIAGRSDYYRINSFKNDTAIEAVGRFNLAKDASFIGDAADGFVFILPIRRSINFFDKPFEIGDTSKVELYSLNHEAWTFLSRVNTEASNGGLFSIPPANIKSNILDAAGQVQNEVLGVFSMMAVEKEAAVNR